MMVLDAGAFVALERNDRAMWRRLKGALIDGEPPITHGGVVGQVWRGGTGRQVLLARALQAVDGIALTVELGRQAGLLLTASGTSDVVDAAVVVLANHEDIIITSDPGDIARLVETSGRRIDVVPT
ncbi:MAG: hypothetical protein KC481_21590 [Acidimicrobiaceae bacterium]|jgi:hypothetical protein|nr:hypothetical protein [Acidimicrobiaceae bacterium]